MKQQKIICAAIYFDDGQVYDHQPKGIEKGFVVAGHRHHNCFMTLKIAGFDHSKYKKVQGFLTDNNEFVNRTRGRRLAYNAGQVTILTDKDGRVKELFSEDLY